MKKKLIRVTTVAMSQNLLLKGQLRFLNEFYDVVALASDDGQLAEVAEREGVRTIAVPMRRKIALWSDLRSLWRLYRVFRRERPHIVHSNTPKGSLLSMLAARFAGVPNRIYTVTGLRYETANGLERWVLMRMEKAASSAATRVIPEGEGVRTALERDRITNKRLRVLHNGNINGVDLEFFSPEAVPAQDLEALRKPGVFTFVFVGRVVRDKGITELVEAFEQLHREHPDTRLVLVGPYEQKLDPLDAKTNRLIKEHPGIEAVGFVNDIRPWLAVADAMVHPSYREGFPNVVLQAAAMGLPVIVTDINGSNEIVSENLNGTIVPARDVVLLLDAMRRFREMPPEGLARLGAGARADVERRFDCRDVHRALLDMYNSLG